MQGYLSGEKHQNTALIKSARIECGYVSIKSLCFKVYAVKLSRVLGRDVGELLAKLFGKSEIAVAALNIQRMCDCKNVLLGVFLLVVGRLKYFYIFIGMHEKTSLAALSAGALFH